MVSIRSTKPNNQDYSYRYYKCGQNHRFGNTACVHDPVPARELETDIFQLLLNEISKSTKQSLLSRKKAGSGSLEGKLRLLEEQRKKLQRRQVNIAASSDLFDTEAFREIIAGLRSRLQTVEQQIQIVRGQIEENDRAENKVYTVKEVLADRHRIKPDEIQKLRALFHKLIERIDIYDKTTITHIKFKFDLYN
jgi:site-specific DNA recombinase